MENIVLKIFHTYLIYILKFKVKINLTGSLMYPHEIEGIEFICDFLFTLYVS